MSEMSSFYGGRQGSPFIIVKRFDGIDIPQSVEHPVYTSKSYAVEPGTVENIFKIVTKEQGGNVPVDEANNKYLIAKTGENKRQYTFENHFNDGSQINDTQYHFPYGLAQGMVQCFEKGAKSASEVNYGEYVLIDTVEGVNDYTNPDNGKVFRRGMNIDSDLAGAEYIGCIVGPKGEIIELKYGHYEDIMSDIPYAHTGDGQYDLDHEDLIFGSYIDHGTRVYEDAIKYAYVTLEDEYHNVIGSMIGFKIPVPTMDYEARSMSPYENRATDPVTHKYYNYDLISEDPTQYIDNRWQHAFYQKWQIKVPHGYHGVNVGDFQVVPTKTMPAGFKSIDFAGTSVYSDSALTTKIGTLTTSVDTILDGYDPTVNYMKVRYNNLTAYVKKEDCYADMLRYRETNFDNIEAGENSYFCIGYIDTIERMYLSDNGILSVYYRGDNGIQNLEEKIRWIYDVALRDDGTLVIYYNTTHTPQGSSDPYELVDGQGRAHDHQQFIKVIRTINDVDIQTVAPGQTDEGTGDQKLRITYNVTDSSGHNIVDIIGNPLNYIIESAISVPNAQHPDVPYCHLLVYYADPALRASFPQEKRVTWYSEKLGKNLDDWIDLGLCKGEPCGIHILKDVNSLDELKDSQGHDIPPERLEDDQSHVINPNAAGWACTLTEFGYMMVASTDPDALLIVADGTSPLLPNQIEISTVEAVNPGQFQIGDYVQYGKLGPTVLYFYDYEIKEWYYYGTLDISMMDPRYIIVKSRPQAGTTLPVDADVSMLNERGIWLASQQAKSAY